MKHWNNKFRNRISMMLKIINEFKRKNEIKYLKKKINDKKNSLIEEE